MYGNGCVKLPEWVSKEIIKLKLINKYDRLGDLTCLEWSDVEVFSITGTKDFTLDVIVMSHNDNYDDLPKIQIASI